MKKILKLKHWQLFLLLIGMPFALQLIFLGSFINDTDSMTQYIIFPIVMLIYTVFFIGWFWEIGTQLQSKLPDSLKMNVTLFKVFMIIPAVYLLFYLTYSILSDFNFIQTDQPPGFAIFSIWEFFIPIHLFSMFCLFYGLWFNAKTLKTIELQKKVKFEEYAGEFFLIWFFPIGIWYIQPRINKLVND